MTKEAVPTAGSRPYVLFVSNKWNGGDPASGRFALEQSFRESLENTGLARFFPFYYDEYFENYKHPGDTALIALCQADRPDLIVLSINADSGQRAPHLETVDFIRKKMHIPVVSLHPEEDRGRQLANAEFVEPHVDLLVILENQNPFSQLQHPEKYVCLQPPLDSSAQSTVSSRSAAQFWGAVFSRVLSAEAPAAPAQPGGATAPETPAILRGRTPRILFITLEFPTWQDARACGWAIRLGFEDGFSANAVDFRTLVSYPPYGGKKPSWADHAREFLGTQKFDQIWMESVHTDVDKAVLDWLTTVAPVRVGMVFESLTMPEEEVKNNPEGCEMRRQLFLNQKGYFTHIVAIDEADVNSLNEEGRVRAFWMPLNPIPRKYIRLDYAPPLQNMGLFYGSAYGARKAFLDSPELSGLLMHPPAGPEHKTEYPELFDRLHEKMLPLLAAHKIDQSSLDAYMDILRRLRAECFRLYLEGLRQGCAVVNLPQYAGAYAGRVTEGMAAGRPLISFEIENRPRTREIFEDGHEILLYRRNQPGQLAEHLRRIIREPGFGIKVAENAKRKLLAKFTMEQAVKDVLKWIES